MSQAHTVADADPHSGDHRPIPLFDPQAQYRRLHGAIDTRVADVLARGAYVNGPEIAELEAQLAERAGVEACIGCANGTDAIVLALMALDIGPGDAVFVPAFTYVATAGAVLLAGATPVFCDVRADSANLDADDLARQVAAVAAAGRLRPKAVIPVDLYGLPADTEAIRGVAEGHDLHVVADAAQSFGAARGGVQVGALAPVTTVSFYPTKPLGCAGDGGAILTQDPDLAIRLRRMRTHGTDASQTAQDVGMNSRLDTLQAAILLAKLPALDAERGHRERLAQRYDTALDGAVGTAPRDPDCTHLWALYTITSDKRDQIQAALAEARVSAAVYYSAPVHVHPAYRAYGDGPGSLPVSERLADTVLSLPLTADMSEAEVDRVAEVVRRAAAAS